jgi:hypothetical protein
MEVKKRIICDVNIWYYIGNGSINLADIEDLFLVASAQNIIELSSTPNLLFNPERVKRALLAINNFASEIIPVESFDYVIKEYIDANYVSPSEETLKNDYYILLSWAKGESSFSIDTDDEKQQFKSLIDTYDKRGQKYVQDVNEALSKIRHNKNNKLKKGQSDYQQEYTVLQVRVIDMVFDIISYRTGLSKNAFFMPTNQLEFMIKSWARLYRNLISGGNAKLLKNDQVDKGYLPYVGKDDQFWSGDLKFLNKIRLQPKDPEINKFLFDPNRSLINDISTK